MSEKIILFNPGQSSLNIGDEIIEDACTQVLNEVFKDKIYISISTHLPISNLYMKNIEKPEFKFVLGSNLLMSNMCGRFRQWDIKIWNKNIVKDTILLGVGWHQYSKKTNLYTKYLYKAIFSKEFIHSVRDEYTKNKMEEIGIKNVLNTGCPTMWNLTEEHCKKIPTTKSDTVVCTLTDYHRDATNDVKLLHILKSNYKKIYFWPQGIDDYQYIKELQQEHNVEIVPPTLTDYDRLLENEEMDFIGTRLHGGIRAMQKKHRTIIISIDNRAEEMAKDYNINIVKRDELDKLEGLINSNIETKINLPKENIEKWKEQFKQN